MADNPASTPATRLGFARGAAVIFQREAGAYFDSSIAYIYAAVFLLLSSGIYMNGFFLDGVLQMDEYFRVLPYLLVLFIPAITMRSWSEERSQGTIELILTLPLRPSQIILGKFLAAMAFYLAVLLGSLPIVFMLVWLGGADLGLIAASYLGAACLGSFFLSLGIAISSLTREQIVSFVTGTFACALFVLSGQEQVVEVLDGLSRRLQMGTWLYETVSVLPHYQSFCRGVISASDLLYFLLLSAFFLILNQAILQLQRR